MADKSKLSIILKITSLAEQALIAFIANDNKGLKKYLTTARDTIDSILATL